MDGERRSGFGSFGRRILLNFEHFEYGVFNCGLFRLAHRLSGHPEAIWRPIPARTGLNLALRSVKLGRPLEKWFTQT